MPHRLLTIVSGIVLGCCLASAMGQVPNRPTGGKGPPPKSTKDKTAESVAKILEDQRLYKLHETFVTSVVKLADEYEAKKDYEKARHCYEQLMRLLPGNDVAAQRMKMIRDRESVAETKIVKVLANNSDWTDSGLIVGADKPVTIQAQGQWTLRMTFETGPEGVDIPKELQSYPIGALLGRILTGSGDDDDGRPFVVGAERSFIANQTGRLQLRIYAADPKSNTGEMTVKISGSFEKKAP